MLYLIVFILAFLAGFSMRRASICLVRATHEVIEKKPPKTLFFVIEALIISLSITMPAMLFFPENIFLATSYEVSWTLFFGSALYGLGAALNGACALGTLNQLVGGRFDFVGTIIGVALGFFVFLEFQIDLLPAQKVYRASIANNLWLFIPLLILVWGVSFCQIKSFLKKSDKSKLFSFKQYLVSSVTRDFISVSIFGFCSGVIYLLLGKSWDYTSFIMGLEQLIYKSFLPHMDAMPNIDITPVLIATLALVSGIVVATKLSKSYAPKKILLRNFCFKIVAGTLMGAAVGFIPGGNDSLILYGLPGLAIHAMVGIVFMMMAIAVFMILKKKMFK